MIVNRIARLTGDFKRQVKINKELTAFKDF